MTPRGQVQALEPTRTSGSAWPRTRDGRLRIHDGTLEAAKWLGFVLMLADHINRFLLDDAVPGVLEASRVVAPLFLFVLAYNLARPQCRSAWSPTAWRLAVFAALATPAYAFLRGHWWPLNVLWLLLACVLVAMGLSRNTWWSIAGAGLVFIGLGALGEFFWPGLVFFLVSWSYAACPSIFKAAAGVVALAAFTPINGTWAALLAVPPLAALPWIELQAPRWKWAFYVGYPLHLSAIAVLVLLRN